MTGLAYSLGIKGDGPHVTLLDLGMARVKGGRVLIKASREHSASTGITEERACGKGGRKRGMTNNKTAQGWGE